jgi:hypothetical protein
VRWLYQRAKELEGHAMREEEGSERRVGDKKTSASECLPGDNARINLRYGTCIREYCISAFPIAHDLAVSRFYDPSAASPIAQSHK